MEHYYLDFEPMSKMFYVADSVIRKFENEGKVPIFELGAHDYMKIGCGISPDFDAPIIGFLAERSGNCYSIKNSSLLAIAKKGFRIRLLTYEHCEQQLNDCSGVILEGTSYVFPKSYYVESWKQSEFGTEMNVQACLLCLRQAIRLQIPILGIGDCALVIACDFGLKIYPDIKCIETPIQHMTNKPEAHRLNVLQNSPLSRLFFNNKNQMFVNSRHTAILAPKHIQYEIFAARFHIDIRDAELPFDIYAEANDGVPEAWGTEKLHILCVQWYPESNPSMQGIYEWLAEEISMLY